MVLTNSMSCRAVLWWMVLWGTGVNYMLRVAPNVVIVAVVKPPDKLPSKIHCNFDEFNSSVNEDLLDPSITSTKTYGFTWDEYEQGLMLGAYYWLHWITEIPGGVLARRYGTKFVFGIGNLLATLMGLALPLAMKYHPYANIFIRVLQGVVAGVAFPSTHDLTAKWIPRNERSQFVSAYMGGGIGIAITYAISGYLIQFLGWDSVFYITSLGGLVWYGLWLLLVYDSPAQHPRISQDEKRFIFENIENSEETESRGGTIPWTEIFRSGPVWVSILSNWSCVWGYYTLMTQAPAYFAFIHGWSIEKTGVLAGIPHLLTFAFSWTFGKSCDWLLQKQKFTLTNVRKFATLVSVGGPGLMTIGLSYSGCTPSLAFFFMFTGIMTIGAVSSGPLANLVDLSPNYASVLLGLCGVIADAAGFISPMIVGLLTYDNQSVAQWQLIFFICAFNMGIGCVVYLIWGSAEEQSWSNNRRSSSNSKDERAIELNTSN